MKFSYAKKLDGLSVEVLRVIPVATTDDEYVKENSIPTLRLGWGESTQISKKKLPLLFRRAIQEAKKRKFKRIALSLAAFSAEGVSPEALAELFAVESEISNYRFTRYKTPPKEGWNFVEEVIVVGEDGNRLKKYFERGQVIAEAVNCARDLANTPGGDMTPSVLATEAKKLAAGTSARVTVLGVSQMKKLGMGGVLGVGKGSDEEPKFIIVEYHGAGKEKPTVLVGKGITFDSGGVNIKTGDSMLGMNLDMSGGAVVINAVILAAKLKLKKNVIALVPAAENMPSGGSYRPGDVLRTISGKTIEVLNTDAEGRVVLADALGYAERYDPAVVIDVATLTGAAIVALGERASAVFSKDDSVAWKLVEAGDKVGEPLWRMPLWDEYEADVKGTFGDVTNTHNKNSRHGGAINGAIFLYQFAKKYPWAHIDMAPRMTAIPENCLAEGSSGEPLRTLFNFVEDWK